MNLAARNRNVGIVTNETTTPPPSPDRDTTVIAALRSGAATMVGLRSGSNPTPGPWTNDNGLVNGKESRERFAAGVSLDIFDASEWPAELHDEAMANAALIGAGLDMLVALKEARDFIQAERDVRFDSCTIGGGNTLDQEGAVLVSEADARLAQIDAAIARAEGRSP